MLLFLVKACASFDALCQYPYLLGGRGGGRGKGITSEIGVTSLHHLLAGGMAILRACIIWNCSVIDLLTRLIYDRAIVLGIVFSASIMIL